MSIFVRDSGCCVFCGSRQKLTVDHVLARSWGGDETAPWNLVTACRACNDAKGNMDHTAFAGMVERYPDAEPIRGRFGTRLLAADLSARVEAATAKALDPVATLAALEIIRANRRKGR